MEYEVIGLVVAETKKGNIGTTIYLAHEHDEYRQQNAKVCIGNACSSEYLRGDYSGKVKVGDTVTLSYTKGYMDKAVLSDITVVG